MGISRNGKKTQKRARGGKKALIYYVLHHRPAWSNWLVKCQIGGEDLNPSELTVAHKIARSQIKPGTGEGEGENMENIWAACWYHHSKLDLRPKMKRELMQQKVDCKNGGILNLTTEQKIELGVTI